MRSRPHGHVATVLGTALRLELPSVIDKENSPSRNLVLVMILARILEPGSKLALARGLNPETCLSTLGEILGVQSASSDELSAAMDWLVFQQERIA